MDLVYIPLCLYFNRMKDTNLNLFNRVYIPLCLYFNPIETVKPTAGSKFTFHYVSILIKGGQLVLGGVNKFTFHYVSILMRILKKFIGRSK